MLLTWIFPGMVFPAAKWYSNDTLSAASGGLTVVNLLEGDIICARLSPDPGDYPLKILTMQILVKGGPGGDYIAKIYDGSAAHPYPGSEIFSKTYLVVPDIFFNIDLSMEGIYIYSGDFVAGYEIVSRTYAYPGTVVTPEVVAPQEIINPHVTPKAEPEAETSPAVEQETVTTAAYQIIENPFVRPELKTHFAARISATE